MLQIHSIYKSILLFGCFLFFILTASGQNWEVDLLKNINPDPPTSQVWNGITKSTKFISAGVPVTMFVAGLIKNDKELRLKSAEAIAALGSTVISTELLKIAVNRQRPYQKYPGIYPYENKEGKSFPSGHASVAFATATTLSLQYKKWYIVVPSYAWAAAVGYSRMYLGMHYPTDVLTSAVVGGGTAWLSHIAANKLLRKSGNSRKRNPL